jgi:hypothetical protein
VAVLAPAAVGQEGSDGRQRPVRHRDPGGGAGHRPDELTVFSYVGRGDPDLGAAFTAAVLYSF